MVIGKRNIFREIGFIIVGVSFFSLSILICTIALPASHATTIEYVIISIFGLIGVALVCYGFFQVRLPRDLLIIKDSSLYFVKEDKYLQLSNIATIYIDIETDFNYKKRYTGKAIIIKTREGFIHRIRDLSNVEKTLMLLQEQVAKYQ